MTEVVNILVVVQVAHISRHTVEVTHILCLGHFLAGAKGLVHLLTVASTNHLYLVVCMEDLLHCLSQRLDGGSRCFLHKQVAGVGVSECEHHKIDGLVERHHEAGHLRHGNGHGFASLDLFDKQRDNTATAAHHIAVTGGANHRTALAGARITALVDGQLLHQGLGHTHRVDRISGLVGREHHHALHLVAHSGLQHVLRTKDVGTHSLHRVELAGRHLLQCCGTEHIIHTVHSSINGIEVTHITNDEMHLARLIRMMCLKPMTHLILLLFVTRENTNLLNITSKESTKNGITK